MEKRQVMNGWKPYQMRIMASYHNTIKTPKVDYGKLGVRMILFQTHRIWLWDTFHDKKKYTHERSV